MTAEICCGLASNDKEIFGSSYLALVPHEPCCNPNWTKGLVKKGCKMVIFFTFTVKRIESF